MGQNLSEQNGDEVAAAPVQTLACTNIETGEIKTVKIDETTTIADFKAMLTGQEQPVVVCEKYNELAKQPRGPGWVSIKGTSYEGPCFTDGCKNTSVISVMFRDYCQICHENNILKFTK